MSEVDIELSSYVNGLRAELEALALAAADKDNSILFKLDPVEIELTVVAEKSAKTGGKLKFSILGWGADLEGGGAVTSAQTQKMTLRLTPFRRRAGSDEGNFAVSTLDDANEDDDDTISPLYRG